MTSAGVARNLRILVIDDNRAIHDDFRKILSSGSNNVDALTQAESVLFDEPSSTQASTHPCFEMESALQGQEGLDRVRRAVHENRPFAMAFVDMRMPPGWDGIETVTRIWEVQPDLQVVICTAF